MKAGIDLQTAEHNVIQAQSEALKITDKQRAIELQTAPAYEQIKRHADQAKRRQAVEQKMEIFRQKVVP